MTAAKDTASERGLLVCPFCGDDPVLLTTIEDDSFQRHFEIRCDTCAIGVSEEYRSDTIAAWNTRAPASDAPVRWMPTHQHVKTGGMYRVIGEATREADMSAVIVYESYTRCMWVRPKDEFYDGRFVALSPHKETSPPTLQTEPSDHDMRGEGEQHGRGKH